MDPVFDRIYYAGSELFILAGIVFIFHLTGYWKSRLFKFFFVLIAIRISIYQTANIGFNLIAENYPEGFWFVSHQVMAGLESLSIPVLAFLWGRSLIFHREKVQARIIAVSTICGTAIGMLLDFLVGSKGYPPVSYTIPLLWMAAICHAILRYGLMRFSPASVDRFLMNHLDQAVFMVDCSWNVTDINSAGRILLEKEESSKDDMDMKDIFIDAEQIKHRIEAAISSKNTSYSHTEFIRTARNTIVQVIANFSLVNDCWGDRIGILIICYPEIDLQAFVQHFKLSERQTDILRHIISGRSQQQTAEALFISLATVKSHTATLYAKLGISSRSELYAVLRDGHMQDQNE
jgi:DNA-binding CsgD family transcriptional regulator